ncbi:MAG: hypothetical protein ACRD3Y_02565 [Bryobacteraceae bacterium]
MDIYRLIDDISRHDTTAPVILVEGAAAVPALARYLDAPPSSVPHARLFAVSMLNAIPVVEATVALRRALHRHELQGLSPTVAESEWLVQNAAFAVLAGRLGNAIIPEIDYGLDGARLAAAVEAVGRLRLEERIPTLVEMLADDTLAEPARSSLARFGSLAAPVLLAALNRTGKDVISLKRAIASVDLLAQCSPAKELEALRVLLGGTHPALAAAAGLALVHTHAKAPVAELSTALVRGTLLSEAGLAERCFDALDTLPDKPLSEAVLEVLDITTLPDLYGDPRNISDTARVRLVTYILCRSGLDAPDVIEQLPEAILLRALRRLKYLPAGATIAALRRHSSKRVRKAAEQIAHADGS